eukprot:4018783-Pleurochrysis_carterae.AAC.2
MKCRRDAGRFHCGGGGTGVVQPDLGGIDGPRVSDLPALERLCGDRRLRLPGFAGACKSVL